NLFWLRNPRIWKTMTPSIRGFYWTQPPDVYGCLTVPISETSALLNLTPKPGHVWKEMKLWISPLIAKLPIWSIVMDGITCLQHTAPVVIAQTQPITLSLGVLRVLPVLMSIIWEEIC